MDKVDPMEMSDDFFEFANKGSDWFMDKEARCLDASMLREADGVRREIWAD
jgi:hypothetical protein